MKKASGALNLIYIFFTIYMDVNFFNFDSQFNDNSRVLYIFIKIFWICSLISAEKLAVYVWTNRKDKYYRTFIKFFCIYGGTYFLIFLLLFPGNWGGVGDELLIYWGARNLWIWPQQGKLAGMIMIWQLMFYPAAWMPVFIQLLVTAGILTRISTVLWDRKRKAMAVWVMMIGFSFPAVSFAANPMRIWLFSMFFLALVSEILFAYEKGCLTAAEMVYIAMILVFLVNCRTESKFLMLIYPFIIILLEKDRINRFKYIAKTAAVIIVSVLCINMVYDNFGGGSVYRYNSLPLVSFVCPLSVILSNEESDLSGMEEDLENINKVFPVKDMTDNSSSVRFWNGRKWIDHYENPTREQVFEFAGSAIKICVKNMDQYIRSRIQMFAASMPEGGCSAAQNKEEIKDWGERNHVTSSNLYLDFNNADGRIRNGCSRLFANAHKSFISPIVGVEYNFIIPCLALPVCMLDSLIKKKSNIFLVTVILSMQFMMLFLLIPSAHCMYYITFYLCGWFILGKLIDDYVKECGGKWKNVRRGQWIKGRRRFQF